MLAQSLGGWFIVAIFLAIALFFDRWMTFGYPDSLWWMIALGGLIAAPAVGWVSLVAGDALTWALQVLVVAAGVLAIQVWTGPTCTVDAACGVIGAQGTFGRIGSVVALAIVAATTWYLALVMYRWAESRRASDVGTVGSAITGMIWPFFLLGAPLMIVAIPVDAALRSAPAHAKQAVSQVSQYCFDDATSAPDLKLRPSPEPVSTYYNTFLVRVANDSRKTVKGAATGPWLQRASASPYEAMIAFNDEGDRVFLACRRVDPASGVAIPADIAAPTYGEAENPFKPQDLLTQPTTPAPVAKPAAKKKADTKE